MSFLAALFELRNSLAESNDAVVEGKSGGSSWQERMDNREENWANHRSDLFTEFLTLSGEAAVSVS